MRRRHVLTMFGLGTLALVPGCNFSKLFRDDPGDIEASVSATGDGPLPGSICYLDDSRIECTDDRETIHNVLDRFCRAHADIQHGRVFAVTASVISTELDLTCRSCHQGILVDNMKSEYTFDPDEKGPGGRPKPIYVTFANCNKCGKRDLIHGSKLPAPDIDSFSVAGVADAVYVAHGEYPDLVGVTILPEGLPPSIRFSASLQAAVRAAGGRIRIPEMAPVF